MDLSEFRRGMNKEKTTHLSRRMNPHCKIFRVPFQKQTQVAPYVSALGMHPKTYLCGHPIVVAFRLPVHREQKLDA